MVFIFIFICVYMCLFQIFPYVGGSYQWHFSIVDPFARGNPHGCASKVAASWCNWERLVVDLSVPVGYGYVKQLLTITVQHNTENG